MTSRHIKYKYLDQTLSWNTDDITPNTVMNFVGPYAPPGADITFYTADFPDAYATGQSLYLQVYLANLIL
jgi:hypothetical protein